MTVPIRKFEMGCNTDYLGDFLEKCGWQVSKRVGTFKVRRIGSPGKWKTMSKAKLMEIFDQERIKRGLEPVRKPEDDYLNQLICEIPPQDVPRLKKAFRVKQSKLKVTHGA